jgi:glyoxylase-like metal-dependent hydrolase (beta-lactamase superfamily II)
MRACRRRSQATVRIARFFRLVLVFVLAAAAHAVEPIIVADNVYAFIGAAGEIAPKNKGRVGNAGFIVGPSGVIVIDTGVSYRHAREMRAAIHQITKLPVRLAIITHGQQDFIFGNALYAGEGAKLLAHRKTAELIRSRCENCLKLLKQTLGEREMRGSKVVVPTKLVEESTTINEAGVELRLIHLGWAATPGDLAVFHPESGVLFAGGMVDAKRVPELRDAKLKGWLQALPQLSALPVKHVVPGHGPLADAQAIDEMARYLSALETKTRALYEKGLGLAEATQAGDLEQYKDWALYAEQHHRNVHRVYLQIEEEDLAR